MEYRPFGRSGLTVAVPRSLAPDPIAQLDAASRETPIDPYWHRKGFDARNSKPTAR